MGYADPTKQRRYESLARGPYFDAVVDLATAYVGAAIDDPARTEGEYWALSCLPGTTTGRLSALTMRITDMLVIYRADPDGRPIGLDRSKDGSTRVDALMIVERSTLEAGFGRRSLARRRHPRLAFTDSDYHGAGTDQMMISGPAQPMVRALGDERVAEAARGLAARMMGGGRVMHWRGHNPLLTDHVLGRT
jgi:hypothetical protein